MYDVLTILIHFSLIRSNTRYKRINLSYSGEDSGRIVGNNAFYWENRTFLYSFIFDGL